MLAKRLDHLARVTWGEAVRRVHDYNARIAAIAPGTPRARRFGHLGEGSVIGFPSTALFGERWMRIGDHTMIAPHVTLTAGYGPHQTTVHDPAVVIGDRCVIGLRCGIVAHESIVIGDDVWFGQSIYVTDANHGYEDVTLPPGNQLGPHEPVRIDDGAWVGHGSVILPGSHIGRHVVVAAGSVVTGHIPDFSVAAGVPAKVVRRWSGDAWERVDRADR